MNRSAQRLHWPDRVAERWEEVTLGEDEYGVWGCLPSLSPVEISNGDVVRLRYPLLFCYPRDRWWVALFKPGPERIAEIHHPGGRVEVVASPEQIYVHMATPASHVPALTEASISFVDLVLDVIRLPDGVVTVLDEDEIEPLVAQWSIPLDAIANARRACEEVAGMLREGAEPFGEVWMRWLDCFRGEEKPTGTLSW